MKSFLSLLIIGVLFASCVSKVNPNEWVVSTATCWNTMTVSKAGDMVPRLVTNCDRMIVLPATSLAMELDCETKFADRVAGNINLKGNWRISDPTLFIKSAKSITSAATGEGHKIDPNVLESIENAVVDKMWVDMIREYTPTKQAGISEKEVEDDLVNLCRTKLAGRGVEFDGMSVNVNFGPQTEEALDVVSAVKFYDAAGLGEFGKEVIKSKAGATRIVVDQKNEVAKQD